MRFSGADAGAYHLNPVLADTDRDDLRFVRALPLALAADPAAEILIAYEMNGEPLRPDHGAPFRLIVPHWYAVASVKWLQRIDVLTEPYAGEFQTGHYMYEWPDRRARGGQPDARARADHRARRRLDARPRNAHGARQGVVGDGSGDPGGRQPHRRRRLAPGAGRAAVRARTTGRTGRSTGRRRTSAATRSARGRRTPPATPSRRSRPGTGSDTATTPSRSSTSTWPEGAPGRSARRARRGAGRGR